MLGEDEGVPYCCWVRVFAAASPLPLPRATAYRRVTQLLTGALLCACSHPGYFGKVGMRYFHKTQNKFFCPVINLDKLWTLVSEVSSLTMPTQLYSCSTAPLAHMSCLSPPARI